MNKPAAAVDDALTIPNAIWNTYSDEEKSSCRRWDSEHAVDGAPGSFDVSNADSLSYQLTFPADDASLIDSAASLVHDESEHLYLRRVPCRRREQRRQARGRPAHDHSGQALDVRLPDKLVIVTVGQSVFSVYGSEELVNTFRDKLLASYPTAAAVYDEAINA